MKPKNLRFAWVSLCLKFLNRHFSTKIIIKAFVGAFLLANFIFLSLFENSILEFISPFLTICGIFIIINLSRAGFFAAGFFTGILWFYWICFSFVYYGLIWLMPFIVLFIGLIYALIFWAASFPSFIVLRAIMLFLVSYVHPFGFNWFNLEATLVPGIFDPGVRGLIFIFLAVICLTYITKFYKFIAFFICLVCALRFESNDAKILPFEIKLVNTQIPQNLKWDKELRNRFINENLALIDAAINAQFRAIVLPESAFPIFMPHEKVLQIV
ncbi:MAG: apolipoprotein N-acyltransferase, partial [Campylobacter sp.]|nr:apolipoprotein N-acyltransferase [Campylobacter sp.]